MCVNRKLLWLLTKNIKVALILELILKDVTEELLSWLKNLSIFWSVTSNSTLGVSEFTVSKVVYNWLNSLSLN